MDVSFEKHEVMFPFKLVVTNIKMCIVLIIKFKHSNLMGIVFQIIFAHLPNFYCQPHCVLVIYKFKKQVIIRRV